jgi:hypothetical protein
MASVRGLPSGPEPSVEKAQDLAALKRDPLSVRGNGTALTPFLFEMVHRTGAHVGANNASVVPVHDVAAIVMTLGKTATMRFEVTYNPATLQVSDYSGDAQGGALVWTPPAISAAFTNFESGSRMNLVAAAMHEASPVPLVLHAGMTIKPVFNNDGRIKSISGAVKAHERKLHLEATFDLTPVGRELDYYRTWRADFQLKFGHQDRNGPMDFEFDVPLVRRCVGECTQEEPHYSYGF